MHYRPNHLPKTGTWSNDATERIAGEMMSAAIDSLASREEPVECEEDFAEEAKLYVEEWVSDVSREAQVAYGIAGALVVGWATAYLEGVDWREIAAEYFETYQEAREEA